MAKRINIDDYSLEELTALTKSYENALSKKIRQVKNWSPQEYLEHYPEMKKLVAELRERAISIDPDADGSDRVAVDDGHAMYCIQMSLDTTEEIKDKNKDFFGTAYRYCNGQKYFVNILANTNPIYKK